MDPILTALSTYGGTYNQELIGQIFLNLENQGINVLENVKGTQKFWRLRVSKGLKPYTGVFTPANVLNYSDREVSPSLFQFDVFIDPKKYHNTFAADTVKANSKYFVLPYEAYIWKKVTEEIAQEIVESTIYKGIKGGSSSDQAQNICNGFEKRINEMLLSGKPSINTGVWTAANAVEKAEQMYTDAIATYAAMRRMDMNMYCSWTNHDLYIDRYRTLFDKDPENWSDATKPMYLKKTKGKVQLKPVDWLGDSNRIILSPEVNMALATDKLSDINVINIVPDVYGLKAGITGSIDIQVLDDEACFYNELT